MGGRASLILILSFSFTVGYISMNLNRLANRAAENMATYNEVTQSHTLAQAGANVGLSLLYQNPNKRGMLTEQAFSSGPFRGGTFSVRIDSMTPTYILLRSVSKLVTSQLGYVSDTVEVYFGTKKNNSFSMFAWMSNFEGNVFWITGDTVWGRVHTNGNLHVYGRPTFMEKVTMAKGFDPAKPGRGINRAIFKDGYEVGIAPILFPSDLSELKTAANSGGKRYSSDIWVELDPGTAANKDGWAYVYANASKTILLDSLNLNDPASFNGVLMGDQDVHVEGVVDGKLTITSYTDDIIVENDVVYERDPLTDVNCDDLLGLVAEDNVIVADNPANNSDCEIDASVFARDGSFRAENYNSRPVSGILKMKGGIVQNIRGPVGTFSGGVIKTGFSKRYYFDQRLSEPNVRPPFFPGYYTYALRIVNWWESYHIPKFQ